jgi:hypothetical protein
VAKERNTDKLQTDIRSTAYIKKIIIQNTTMVVVVVMMTMNVKVGILYPEFKCYIKIL